MHHSEGSVLIMTLLILLVLSLIVINSFNVAAMELNMTKRFERTMSMSAQSSYTVAGTASGNVTLSSRTERSASRSNSTFTSVEGM